MFGASLLHHHILSSFHGNKHKHGNAQRVSRSVDVRRSCEREGRRLSLKGVVADARARRDKSSEQRLNLSGSWQQGHSAAYNTPFLIQVVCKGSIGPGPEIAADNGSGKATLARGVPGPVEGFPSGVDSNLEAFSYNPAHGSFAASPFPAAAIPMVRIGGSSRTEPNYR